VIAAGPLDESNRFNGFNSEAVETAQIKWRQVTSLKRGVNEKKWLISGP